jgi:hypothetical protein
MKLLRTAVALLAAATFVLGACGGDDDSGSSAKASAGSGGSERDYRNALASALAAKSVGSPLVNNKAEAECTAKKVVDAVGQKQLIAAGLTVKALKSDGFGSHGYPELSRDDAGAFVDAIFACVDLSQQVLGGTAQGKQQTCLNAKLRNSDELHSLYENGIRKGRDNSSIDEPAGRAIVDTIFQCVPQGEFFKSSLAGTLEITEAQATCLNDSLASSNDYRDAVVAGIIGVQAPAGDPPYLDELVKCVPLDQLSPTPTTTG